MSIAYELHLPESEVESWPPHQLAKWVAFLELRAELQKDAQEKASRRARTRTRTRKR